MKRRKLFDILTGKRNIPGETQIYIGGTNVVSVGYCTVPSSLLTSLSQYYFCEKNDNKVNIHSDFCLTDKGKKWVDEYNIYGLENFSPKRKTPEQLMIEREIEQMPDPDE